jgi:acyl-CoA dehydrogenase
LIPLEREYRHDEEGPMPERLLKPLQEKTKSMGLWMLDVPTEYGGAGLGLLPRCIIHEGIARSAALPFRSLELFGPEVRPVLFHCNDEQRERFLKPILRGEIGFYFAQDHGGVGLTKDLLLEWWYRQIRSTGITEGANEVLRWRLAQNLIRSHG